jgi:hypothetical protein
VVVEDGAIYMEVLIRIGRGHRNFFSLSACCHGIMFFSHSKSANSVFQPDFSVKRTGVGKG